MSKGNTFETEILDHILNNAAIALVGDAAGLQPSAAPGNLYLSLHTADPSEAGDQTTNEVTAAEHDTYARVAVPRDGTGWDVAAGVATLAAAVSFPAGTGGAGGNAAFFGLGTAQAGAGKLLYSGPINPAIVLGNGQTPQLKTTTQITED